MNFTQFALIHGLLISDLFASEKIKRCATVDHPHSKNGAYFFDGSNGWVMNWEHGNDVIWFDNPKELTLEEKREWAQKKAKKQAEIRNAWKAASIEAGRMIKASKIKPHYYLNSKGFPDTEALTTEDGAMLIPMNDLATNQLVGVQVISWVDGKWTKKMIYGMRAKNAVFRLGNRNALETFLCEGYATGLSIELALRQLRLNASVLVCFSAYNLVNVAQELKGRVYVCADNDYSKTGELCAQKTGLPYVISPMTGEDMNDLHQRLGVINLCKLLMSVRNRKTA